MRVEQAEAGEAIVTMDLAPHMLNNHGAGHGGVLMTLLDVAMANAALSRIDYAREVVTVDLHVGFMSAASGRPGRHRARDRRRPLAVLLRSARRGRRRPAGRAGHGHLSLPGPGTETNTADKALSREDSCMLLSRT